MRCPCEIKSDKDNENYNIIEDNYTHPDMNVQSSIFVFEDEWFIEVSEGDKVVTHIKIEYCPFCGRILNLYDRSII